MLDDNDIEKLKETFATKDDVIEFKDEILTGQDEILQKLNILLDEKTVGDNQDKRQKKVLEIHNVALKSSKILSEEQAIEIDKLRVF
ncbi:MAG: hypothetical protein NT155_00025 [Candidatus Staskawiczbacteria bacterium]|nr:hypothetical protein [Candidatus Staskawiczbacteria bacterium]